MRRLSPARINHGQGGAGLTFLITAFTLDARWPSAPGAALLLLVSVLIGRRPQRP
ncbi:hypothetical protein ACFUEM_13045 [Streptomyces anulatus]|uniref:hypothetical protein n=1 Tax=Streptomyces anulatus TaxID=1892 RepID=UPI0035DD6621